MIKLKFKMHAMGARIGVLKPYWRNLMSALLKVTTRSSVTLDGLHGGSDTALFTSGSAPSMDSSLHGGHGAALFTSGSAPTHSGENTALFTSGSAPSSVSAQSSGALTELFTSGS